jgi:hypothetical protein
MVDYSFPWLTMVDDDYVTIVMFIFVDLCQITTFLNVIVVFWCPSRVMLHSYVRQGLCSIATLPNDYVALWHSSSLSCWIFVLLNGFITLWHSWKVISPCNNPKSLCFFAMSPNGYDALWYSSCSNYVELLCSLMIMWHCDVHQELREIFYVP